ncbi:MAG: ATP-binding protein [Acidobacteriota bacterium]|nr:ATP-binding protein [Acidobacteriota bacterium]
MLDIIKTIISDFHKWELPDTIVGRELLVPLNSRKVITIVGPRRAGKTYFLYSLIQNIEKKIGRKMIIYIDFEDERLSLDSTQLHLILDGYQQLFPETDLKEVYYFFDEIQEISGWEKFIRRLDSTITNNIFLTGSSSKFLSREIASALRGRTISYELFPFSFKEYLKYRKVNSEDVYSTRGKNKMITEFKHFLFRGGYPEVFDCEEELAVKILQSYVDIMLYRDIIERYRVSQVYVIKDMMRRLISNNACMFSVHKYFNDLHSRGIKIGKNTLYDFMDYFTEAYLTFQLNKYDYSIAKQEQALKKIYVNDTGLGAACNFAVGWNKGRLLETMIFLELKKAGLDVYYSNENGECDFIAGEGRKIVSAIQVCYRLNEENQDREIRGLLSALKKFKLSEGHVITIDQEDKIETDGRKIFVHSAWKWLLQG